MVGVLNPFESKINEHSEEDFDDQVRSEGNDSFAREQEWWNSNFYYRCQKSLVTDQNWVMGSLVV